MAQANVLVIYGHGVNSHVETARAAVLAGADRVDTIHFSHIVQGKCHLDDYGLLIFPGGFLDGDDLGGAQAASVRWRHMKDVNGESLPEKLSRFLDRGGLVLGICNGFQLLVRLGLLPLFDGIRFRRLVSLGHNDSGIYEDRWVHLAVNPLCNCIFTNGLPPLYFPVRHGEGKLAASPEVIEMLASLNLIALQYADPATGLPTQEYPYNPNGSPHAIAGLSDPSGHILGLMPHPEAFHHVTNHPGWTRGEVNPPGTLLFLNAVRYLHARDANNAV